MLATEEAKIRLTRAQMVERILAIPNPFKRQAAMDCAARLYAVPPIDENREQALKWLEEGDPEKCIFELFGYRLDTETRRLVTDLEDHSKVMAIGAHDRGKTWVGGACMFGWHWYVKGCEVDEAGQPKGSILALVANKLTQTLQTSWAAIRRHAENAAARGHQVPGWEKAQKLSAPALDGSLWRIHPQLWYISAQSFQAPAAASGSRSLPGAAGLKHPHSILVWIEESNRLPRPMFRTIQGWNRLSKRFGTLNPYESRGTAYDLAESGDWKSPRFSYLNAPDVLNREATIPGGATHTKLETEMRSPFEVRRLGAAGEAQPNTAKGDFLYALPAPGAPDKRGPRADGVPGHPDAEVSLWRPSPEFQAGRLGQFPSDNEAALFSLSDWRDAVELGMRYRGAVRPPDTVGVDTAEGGPDRIVAVPRWGPSAGSIWERYQAAMTCGDHNRAVELTLRCSACQGSGRLEGEAGCSSCFGGRDLMVFGDPLGVQKSKDGNAVAQSLVDAYGTTPGYRLDASAGGYWLEVPLRNLGCKDVQVVSFGAKSPEPLKGQRRYLNMRAAMYGRIAYVLPLGAVAMTADPEIKAGCFALEWKPEERATGAGSKETRYKLPEKLTIKAQLGGLSPDGPDATALNEGEGKVVPVAQSGGGFKAWGL